MVTGIVIPHESELAMQRVEFRNLTDYQKVVGGYIEEVFVDGETLAIIADDEGKLKGLPVNKRATLLWWLFSPTAIGTDELVGDIVILGAPKRGDMTSVPNSLSRLLLEKHEYRVQVCVSPVQDSWTQIGPNYPNFFEATISALRLMEVWQPPQEVKVVAIE